MLVDGHSDSFTVRTRNVRVADAQAKKRGKELEAQAERRAAGLVVGMRMSELLNDYETAVMPGLADGTQASYRDSLKIIRRYFVRRADDEKVDPEDLPAHRQDPTIESIRAAHVQRFLTWRRGYRLDGETANTHNRTLQKDRAVLRRIFSYADKLEYRDGNPVARVDPPKADKRTPVIVTDEQYEALLLECAHHPMLKLYVETLKETGGRCKSEVLWFQFDDVDLDAGFLKVVTGRNGHRTKGGKFRWVPMTPRLVGSYREHFARYRLRRYNGKPTPWVFHHEISRAHYSAGARIKTLHRSFASAARRAKLPEGLHQHDFRHRRVTTWLAEGQDIVKVKEAVGHSDIRTTMDYTHLAREHLRSLVATERRAPA